MHFSPTLNYTDIFNFNKLYNQTGCSKFHGEYDKILYEKFLENAITNNISEDDWPYYTLEDDFYCFNSYGYRTPHEFEELEDGSFDIAIGCSFVESIGVRYHESWVHHYEKYYNRPLINLGKGGATNTYTKLNLFAWLNSNKPKPRNVIILWTEPTRETYIRRDSNPVHFNVKYDPLEDSVDYIDNDISKMYECYLGLTGGEMSSNNFIKIYCETNLLLKYSEINTYNFFIESFWPSANIEKVIENTNFSAHNLSFDIGGGWYDHFHYKNKIFPAADGNHVGPINQLNVFNQIKEIYEKNKSSV